MENEILQQILAELQDVKESQRDLKESQAVMERSLKEVRSDQQMLALHFDKMDRQQAVMESELDTIRHSVVVIENVHGKKIDAIFDGMAGIQERFDRQDRLEQRVENHGERIFALEQVVHG